MVLAVNVLGVVVVVVEGNPSPTLSIDLVSKVLWYLYNAASLLKSMRVL